MSLYCGIDLHSRDCWLAILDDELRVVDDADELLAGGGDDFLPRQSSPTSLDQEAPARGLVRAVECADVVDHLLAERCVGAAVVQAQDLDALLLLAVEGETGVGGAGVHGHAVVVASGEREDEDRGEQDKTGEGARRASGRAARVGRGFHREDAGRL